MLNIKTFYLKNNSEFYNPSPNGEGYNFSMLPDNFIFRDIYSLIEEGKNTVKYFKYIERNDLKCQKQKMMTFMSRRMI